MRRHAPLGFAIVMLSLLVAVAVRGDSRPRWKRLRPGVEFTTMRGDPWCRHGSSEIALLRIDPATVRLRVMHYTREQERRPLTIVEWQRRTRAIGVFNAGQYYPDLSYMGLLVSDGVSVSARPHPVFKAALVADRDDGRRNARVLDLERTPLDPKAPGWRQVAQSFMLFGRDGRPRVKKTDLVAHRTAVAEDRQGRLVIVTSEGGYTLWDFAGLLKRAPLDLSHAMCMDGGYEAEMCVSDGRFHYASFGHWDGIDDTPDPPGASVPLPAVVIVVPE